MSTQVIPLTPTPNQILNTTLNIDGVNKTYQLKIRYNEMADYWVMSILDPATGDFILDSIPLLTGDYPAANILQQYAYLGIGSAYVVNVSNLQSPNYPDDKTLGSDFVLVWGDNA